MTAGSGTSPAEAGGWVASSAASALGPGETHGLPSTMNLQGEAVPRDNPDPEGSHDLAPTARPVVGQRQGRAGLGQVETVLGAGNAEGLAQPARPPAEVPVPQVSLAVPTSCPHGINAFEGLSGPEQNRRSGAVRPANDIRAPVHTVGEVDVEHPGGAEHYPCPRGRASEGMASRVVHPHVRLDFDQAGHPTVRPYEQLADQGATDVACVASEELPLQQSWFQTDPCG